MKLHTRVFTPMTALTVLCASVLSAQHPGMGPSSRMYNPKTETKITGTVEAVTQQAHDHMLGTHLSVKTQDGLKTVLVGPSDFVASKGFTFAKGDSVAVTGSQVTVNGTASIVAREVTKNEKTLILRDKTGRPEWAGSMGSRAAPQQK